MRSNSAKPLIIAGVLVVIVLGLVGWRIIDKKTQDAALASGQKARNGAAPAVDVAIAGTRSMDTVIESIANVESPNTVKLSPKLTGLILSVAVRQGDTVKAGQPLVQIDPTETQGQVLQARQALAEAKFRLAQAQITADPTNVAVRTTIRQQAAALNSAKADQQQVATNYKAALAAAQAVVTDADAKVAAAKSQVDVAEQNLATSEANARNAKAKYDREYSLYQQSFVAAQDLDDAKTALDVANSGVNGSKAQVRAAQSALASSQAQRNSALQSLNIVLAKGISDIADARAHTEQSSASYDLAESNRAQTPAYRANLEALQAEVGAAQGTLSQALARLEDTSLKSTVNGTVTDRGADPGTVVSPGTAVLTIQFLDWVFVTAGIPIEQAPNVRVGQDADIVFDALPGQVYHGKLAQVVMSADPASRQFNIQVKLDNPNHIIRPGMFGKVRVIVKRHTSEVTVPREAVTLDKSGNPTVILVDDKKVAHITPVTLGAQDAKFYEITSGVKLGDTVVTLSYQPVKDGKPVKPNAPKSADKSAKSSGGTPAATPAQTSSSAAAGASKS